MKAEYGVRRDSEPIEVRIIHSDNMDSRTTAPNAIPMREFAPLAEALRREAAESPLAFLPNPGNWGAAFTAEATRCFLAAHEIPFRELQTLGALELIHGFVQRETLLLGGGGAWSNLYPGTHRLAARASRFFRKIIVLPSTFGERVSIKGAKLWARDRFGSINNAPTARFCHDLGLSVRWLDTRPPTAGLGRFFRVDRLSATPEEGADADLSSHGNERSLLQPFLDAIAQYEEVHTDRVHVAIVACLMGRRCHIWPTANPLLADLFASSIAPHFPEAVFHGPLPSSSAQNS